MLFRDLVGSTALSVRLDPEDLPAVIGDYHRGAAEAGRRFDGFVAKYMGDAVLAYFLYPLRSRCRGNVDILSLIAGCRQHPRPQDGGQRDRCGNRRRGGAP